MLRIHARPLTGAPFDVEAVYAALFAELEHSFWLDSSDGSMSYMGTSAGPTQDIIVHDLLAADAPFFEDLQRRIDARVVSNDHELPFSFVGGYVGVLGYELKAECGGVAAHLPAEPSAALLFANRFLAFREDRWFAVQLCEADEAPQWLQSLQGILDGLPSLDAPRAAPEVRATLRHDREAYAARIEACHEHLRDGQSYELCLTNEASAESSEDTLSIYRRLRRACSAPYGALLKLGELHILSASPERFLSLRGRDAETKPIKGTRRRSSDAEEDRRLRTELASSEKDRAENLMIVDLLRNDLGRVCDTGSVSVHDAFAIESYRTVHHMVSTIRGRLRDSVRPTDLVRAMFPGGSMTGAPKIRTMALLDALEAGPRGLYSGALGWFGLDGSVELSIVIRTLIRNGRRFSLGAGGAIVAMSDADEEWKEMLLKAAAPLRALGVRDLRMFDPRLDAEEKSSSAD